MKKPNVILGTALMMVLAADQQTPFFRRMFKRGRSQWAGASRRYWNKPHQGEREKARRLRQFAKGMIGGSHV